MSFMRSAKSLRPRLTPLAPARSAQPTARSAHPLPRHRCGYNRRTAVARNHPGGADARAEPGRHVGRRFACNHTIPAARSRSGPAAARSGCAADRGLSRGGRDHGYADAGAAGRHCAARCREPQEQPAPVVVTLNADGSGAANGAQSTARFSKNKVEYIGCGVRRFDDGLAAGSSFRLLPGQHCGRSDRILRDREPRAGLLDRRSGRLFLHYVLVGCRRHLPQHR